jgi:hypothetical protein
MADSTTNLDLLIQSQYAKEITANALFDAVSPSSLYGRRQSTSGGLLWGYYGGTVIINNTQTVIANGFLTLTASNTNYIEVNPATGIVSSNTSGFTSGYWKQYTVIVGPSTITSYIDHRALGMTSRTLQSHITNATEDTASNTSRINLLIAALENSGILRTS